METNNTNEIWAEYSSRENMRYEISTHGRVRSIRQCAFGEKIKVLNPSVDGYGYKFCYFRIKETDTKYTAVYVHRAMAQLFLGHTINRDTVVDHIDGVKDNNHLSNLQIITFRENLCKQTKRKKLVGYTGVTIDFRKTTIPYKSQIVFKYKVHCLGYYATPEEAHEKYKQGLYILENGTFDEFIDFKLSLMKKYKNPDFYKMKHK